MIPHKHKYILISHSVACFNHTDNIGANKTAKEACIQIATIDDRNIYLVQKDRIEEFIDKGYMEKLAKHFEKDTDKKMIRII